VFFVPTLVTFCWLYRHRQLVERGPRCERCLAAAGCSVRRLRWAGGWQTSALRGDCAAGERSGSAKIRD